MVFKDPLILIGLRNSTARTLLGTVLALFLTSMFAYAVSRPKLRFKKAYMVFGIITMYFYGGIIPFYLLMRDLKLINNFLVYIFPALFSMFNAVIFISFFKTLPASLEESAKIDGANDFYIYSKLILPLSTPVLATIALFIGVGQWNSWLDTTLYTNKEYLETLSHLLVRMINTANYYEQAAAKIKAGSNTLSQMTGITSNALQLATMVVAAFPIAVVYPFLQKYFTKGIMIGSLKG
jgi:putative aldouronate transport system permease protein